MDKLHYVHMYGIELYGYKIKKEFYTILEPVYGYDDYGILDEIIYGDKKYLPKPIPDMNKMELAGRDDIPINYIGYDVIMPYENKIMSKEQMDKNLIQLAIYIYGKNIINKIKPKEIFEAW